jgi:hypothetical protein
MSTGGKISSMPQAKKKPVPKAKLTAEELEAKRAKKSADARKAAAAAYASKTAKKLAWAAKAAAAAKQKRKLEPERGKCQDVCAVRLRYVCMLIYYVTYELCRANSLRYVRAV